MIRKGFFRIFPILLAALMYFYFVQGHRGRGTSNDRALPEKQRSHREDFHRYRPRTGTVHDQQGKESFGANLAPTPNCSSSYFKDWNQPAYGSCQVRVVNGFPEPDPKCTPGGVNPAVTLDVLRDPRWRTRSVRNCESSEAQKHVAYRWYSIEKPRINSNENQVCELDHLVPLELGGADGLGNIWPECGPDEVTLQQRYFKRKDRVENYLTEEVRSGKISLESAQQGIASDWTQYLGEADRWCLSAGKC